MPQQAFGSQPSVAPQQAFAPQGQHPYPEAQGYQSQSGYPGPQNSGAFPASASYLDPSVYQDPTAYHLPQSYPAPAASPVPYQRVAPGRRSPARAYAPAVDPGPDSDEFAAPVINPAPVDAPPASDGSQDPTAYAGLRPPPASPDPAGEAWRRRGRGPLSGMLAGLLAAAVAVAVSVLAATLLRSPGSPAAAVAAILRSTTVANFAGGHFGSREHVILLALPWVAGAVAAAVLGLTARRHRAAGVIGMIAVFGAGAAFAVLTRPGSHAADVIPALVGGVAGAVTLAALASVLARPRD